MQKNMLAIGQRILFYVCILCLFLGSFFYVDIKAVQASDQPIMKVGYLDELLPYSDYHHKKHIANGAIRFLVEKFEKEAGVKTQCIPYLDEGKLYADLKNNKLDVVFPMYGDQNLAKRLGVTLSVPIDKSELLLLYLGEDRAGLENKIGVLDLSNFGRTYAELYLPQSSYAYYPDFIFAIKGLEKNTINSILIQSAQYDVLKQNLPNGYKLNSKVFVKDVNVCFALAPKSSFVGIVNKIISGIPKDELRREIIKATNDRSKLTFMDFVMENIVTICVILVIGFSLLFVGFAWYYHITKKTANVLLEAKLEAEDLLDKEQHLRHELQQAMFKAEHDSMTGLLNKGCFEELLKLHQENPNMACVIIDIDLFKTVNDKYGHEIGDRVIKCVAKAIKASFRETDYVARIGGDEFAVILKEITPDKRGLLTKRIENIRRVLDKISVDLPAVTLSIGIAFADEVSRADAKEMFRHADIALYGVKQNGRDGFNFYN